MSPPATGSAHGRDCFIARRKRSHRLKEVPDALATPIPTTASYFPMFIGGTGRTTENHGVEWELRFARSALNPYSVALDVLPASFVLKFFLDCRRHMFLPLSGARLIQAIALGGTGDRWLA